MYRETETDNREYSQSISFDISPNEPFEEKYLFRSLEELVSREYPQLLLPKPLFFQENDYIAKMHTEELQFAYLMHGKGNIVYREPRIKDMDILVPDFYIYNPFKKFGKLIEITLMAKDGHCCSKKTKDRKLRQKDNLNRCGIPFTILYRENLDRIFTNNVIDIV